MNWEKKTLLISMGELQDSSSFHRERFQEFVLENVHDFDEQAWCMFANLNLLIPEQMSESPQFWSRMFPFLLEAETKQYRERIRLHVMVEICKELKMTKTEL